MASGRAISSVVARVERHGRVCGVALLGILCAGGAFAKSPQSSAAPSVTPASTAEPSTSPSGAPAPSTAARAGGTAEPSKASAAPLALGRAESIAIEALAANGRWLAYCQPTEDADGDGKREVRTGPRGEPRGDGASVFYATGGEARPIDELLAFDASGRFAIVRSESKPWLYDSENGMSADLSPLAPDLRADEEFSLVHRALSFDRRGQKLLVLRKKSDKQYEVDLFDLAAGYDATKKQTWALAPGEVWRARLSPDGRLAIFESVPEGLREGGAWPVPPRKAKLQRCHGLVVSPSGWSGRGGPVTHTVVSTRGGLPTLAPGFVAPFGDGWLRREKSGRLLLVSGSTQKQLASARCGARILHADPSRELLIVACEHFTLGRPEKSEPTPPKRARAQARPPSKSRFDLYLVGPGYVKDLEADVGLTALDLEPDQTPRLVPLRPGARSVLVDMDRRALIELAADDRVVATYAGRALVRRGSKLSVYDADAGTRSALTNEVKAFPTILVSGRYAYVEPYLVDLELGGAVLEAPGTPLALSETGRLVFAGTPPSTERWATGPLRFVDAPPRVARPAPGGAEKAQAP